MDFIPDQLAAYAEAHSGTESVLLARLNRDTYANVLMPRMLSGHLQGRILSMLSKIKQPKRILEIGTYTGYSALCLAEGLASGGELHTIDKNEELEARVRGYVSEADMEDRIRFHIGDAREILKTLDLNFDLVFIDADKENYETYYELLIEALPSGALIVADNVLWSGKVVDPEALEKDPETSALDRFNKRIQSDERVENVLLPVRDGLMVIRKV